MYVSKPGANFSYLWGSADSCEKFAPFEALTLDEVAARPGLQDLFAACFDFDAPSPAPDSAAVFSLYDRARLTGAEAR
jgi:oligopeptidase A